MITEKVKETLQSFMHSSLPYNSQLTYFVTIAKIFFQILKKYRTRKKYKIKATHLY